MNSPKLKYAELDDSSLKKVHTLEEQLGNVILVMETHYTPAKLSDQQVERLKALEQDLGVVLVAYQS